MIFIPPAPKAFSLEAAYKLAGANQTQPSRADRDRRRTFLAAFPAQNKLLRPLEQDVKTEADRFRPG